MDGEHLPQQAKNLNFVYNMAAQYQRGEPEQQACANRYSRFAPQTTRIIRRQIINLE
jgi:hypothetical protein